MLKEAQGDGTQPDREVRGGALATRTFTAFVTADKVKGGTNMTRRMDNQESTYKKDLPIVE